MCEKLRIQFKYFQNKVVAVLKTKNKEQEKKQALQLKNKTNKNPGKNLQNKIM